MKKATGGIEAQEKARELGLTLRRTESLNGDPEFLEGLADEVLHAIASVFHLGLRYPPADTS